MPLREPTSCANKEDSSDPSRVFLWTLVVLAPDRVGDAKRASAE